MPSVSRLFHFSFPLALLSLDALASGTTEAGVPASTFLQAFLALGLIVALLAGTAWLARKVSGGKGFGHGGMRVIGGVALGPKERIILVEVGEQWLVIGIVPGQIRTLHQLPKGTPPPDELLAPQTDQSFAQWLKHIKERRGNA